MKKYLIAARLLSLIPGALLFLLVAPGLCAQEVSPVKKQTAASVKKETEPSVKMQMEPSVKREMGPSIKKMKITDLEAYIQHSDHPLIVNFWATYCVPCNKEIPYFQSTVEKYQARRVELLLVSLDLPDYYPAKISSFAKKNSYKATIAWLDETNADYFCPKVDARWSGGIPSSLFINNQTHYRRFFDRQLTEPQVGIEIEAMLK